MIGTQSPVMLLRRYSRRKMRTPRELVLQVSSSFPALATPLARLSPEVERRRGVSRTDLQNRLGALLLYRQSSHSGSSTTLPEFAPHLILDLDCVSALHGSC